MSAGFEAVIMRLAAWGPLFHHPPSPMNVPVQMLRAALRGDALDYRTPPSRAFAEDGADIAYVKDCGRAIALLVLADKLRHSIYNIGAGTVMKNGALADAIRRLLPSAGSIYRKASTRRGRGGFSSSIRHGYTRTRDSSRGTISTRQLPTMPDGYVRAIRTRIET